MTKSGLVFSARLRRVFERQHRLKNFLASLSLFLLALLPRAYDLDRFVTADEAKWVYRSAQFLAAFLQGDFAATSVNLTPAVTTTWLGSLGLIFYHRFNQAAIGASLTDWLLSLPEFRTELDILIAVRWPMVLMTSLAIVAIYWLARRLFGPSLAFIAAVFMALDPYPTALSRILGHDAPAAVFMTLALLLLLPVVVWPGSSGPTRFISRQTLWLLASGSMAGLAFLSKAPALFLIPFAGLLGAGQVWRSSKTLYFWFNRLLLWGVAAYLTFVVVWPAAWIDPLGRPLAVVENAFLSATDQEEAETEGYWLVPDLGPFYYVVNGGFKLSPLVMVGTGLALFFLIRGQQGDQVVHRPPNETANEAVSSETTPVSNPGEVSPGQAGLLWLLVFTFLFSVFMTFGDKRSPRYLLPIFPALSLVAAFGWSTVYRRANRARQAASPSSSASGFGQSILRVMFYPGLILAGLIILLPHTPYYFTYFNPLLGGPQTAPHLVKIGWGEGLDQVGRFLQRELEDSRVGTAYASTVAPFFQGDLSGVEGRHLDYLVLYSKQVQAGRPLPIFIRYYEQSQPVFSVDLAGLHYADVYAGPAVQPALSLTPGLDGAVLPQPLGFRPLTPYGQIGQPLEVDVLWLAADPLPASPSTVTLEPLSGFNFSHEGHDYGAFEDEDEAGPPAGNPGEREEIEASIFAQDQSRLERITEGLVVSRHALPTPADLPRGLYALRVDGHPLGEVELRNFQIPTGLAPVKAVFEEQIALRAYEFDPTEDYIALTIAWQAQKSYLPDYTVFAQLLDLKTNERLAGVDTRPVKGEWPTNRWVKGEVVVDKYFIAVPPGLSPGFFKIIVGLYRPETGQRLLLADGQDHWVVPWTLIREE